jgi:hypothetical protein
MLVDPSGLAACKRNETYERKDGVATRIHDVLEWIRKLPEVGEIVGDIIPQCTGWEDTYVKVKKCPLTCPNGCADKWDEEERKTVKQFGHGTGSFEIGYGKLAKLLKKLKLPRVVRELISRLTIPVEVYARGSYSESTRTYHNPCTNVDTKTTTTEQRLDGNMTTKKAKPPLQPWVGVEITAYFGGQRRTSSESQNPTGGAYGSVELTVRAFGQSYHYKSPTFYYP